MIHPVHTKFIFSWYRLNWIKEISLNNAMYEDMVDFNINELSNNFLETEYFDDF